MPIISDHKIPPNRVIGYARTSTEDQQLRLQTDALNHAGASKIFTDQMSGSRDDRPGLKKALAELQPGDTLAVWKLDRLGRSTRHLLETVEGLRTRGVRFTSITEAIDTETATGVLLLTVLGAIASFERSLITERIKAGINAKKKAGERVGRKPVLVGSRLQLAMKMLDEDGMSYRRVARDLQISTSALYASVAKIRSSMGQKSSGPS
jgi:DNA invertase Pin-like site-specific DNA recombinase